MSEATSDHDRGDVPWWRRDTRWSVPAAVSGVGAALGTLAVSVAPGVGGVLVAEAGFGVAAGFAVATLVQLRRTYRRRADDDAETYTDGIRHELAATGTFSPTPIATVTRDTSTDPIAELRYRALGLPQADAVRTITVRLGEQHLRLQHRRGDHEDLTGTNCHVNSGNGTASERRPPDLLVRWVDDDGAAVAGAHRHGRRWTISASRLTLRLEVPDDPRWRPSRRTFLDPRGRAFLLTYETRRGLPVVHLAAPAELAPAEVVLCLWLAQLLDAHAAAGEPWHAPGSDWVLVEDDFLSSVGPGGFGRTFGLPYQSTPGSWAG